MNTDRASTQQPAVATTGSGRLQQSVQKAALRVFSVPFVRRLVSTAAGRATFDAAYWLYKDWIEVPGSSGLAAHLPPGTWAIDVGANVGYFTVKFARWVSGGGKVIALEPEAENFARLTGRLQRLRLTEVVEARMAAAADRTAVMNIEINDLHPADHKLTASGGIAVQGMAIDELVAEAGHPRVGLIKIDTQGAEMMVLQGARETIVRSRPAIFIEIDDQGLRSFGSTGTALLDLLSGYGYRYRLLERSGATEISAQAILERIANDGVYLDVLCVPDLEQLENDGADPGASE